MDYSYWSTFYPNILGVALDNLPMKRHHARDLARKNSNVFALFDQKQISELKEAFSFIDQNGDGVIDREDLQEVFQSLAYTVEQNVINEMLKDSPGSLNFTMFLALLGELLHVYSATSQASPVELGKAFECLERGGRIGRAQLKEALEGGTDRLSEEEVEIVLQEASLMAGEDDFIDYREFIKQLKAPI